MAASDFEDDEILSQQDQQQLEKIEQAETPEELARLREELGFDKTPTLESLRGNSKQEETPKPIVEEQAKAADEPEKTDKPNGETEAPEIKQELGSEYGQPQEDNKDKALITEDFIKKFPEQDRTILKNFLGKPVEELAKSLVNAQRLVGKKAESLLGTQTKAENAPKPQEKIETIHKPQSPDEPKIDNSGEQLKEQLVFAQLKQKYPEAPSNYNDFKEFINDLNYTDRLKCDKILREYEGIESTVDKDVKQLLYIKDNYGEINQKEITTQVEQIKDFVQSKFQLDIEKELGISLQNPEMINSLVLKDGDLDHELVDYIAGVPILRQNALVTKFISNNIDEIVSRISQKNRTEGFKAANETKPIKTLSSAPVTGQMAKDNLSIEEIEKLDDLDEIRKLQAKFM